jgi:hypothetical protein
MRPRFMAIGAFLLVAGTLFALILYGASTNPYNPNEVSTTVYSAVIAAAVGAAALVYGLSSKSQ